MNSEELYRFAKENENKAVLFFEKQNMILCDTVKHCKKFNNEPAFTVLAKGGLFEVKVSDVYQKIA